MWQKDAVAGRQVVRVGGLSTLPAADLLPGSAVCWMGRAKPKGVIGILRHKSSGKALDNISIQVRKPNYLSWLLQ